MKGFAVVLAMLLYTGAAFAQRDLQPRTLVEAPTAGLLPRGTFDLDFRFSGNDGVLGAIAVGLFDRGMIGVSFGASNLLGNQPVVWNPRVEFSGKIRVIEESFSVPAIAVGYVSQGYGVYDAALKRYTHKSKGAYVVASKNYRSPFGQGGVHAGINKSFEDDDGDSDLSGYIGADMTLGQDFAVVAEYDLALNDNSDNSLGSGRGFLNAGVRWAVSKQFELAFDLKNIFRNGQRNPQPDREIRLVYFERF